MSVVSDAKAFSKTNEAAFEAKAEKHFNSHPELPNGRDFRFNSERDPVADKKYRNNFDNVFPNSPGVGY